MDFSKPLPLSILCAFLIMLSMYLYNTFLNKDDSKDYGEYLRIFSFSGIIILGVQNLKFNQKGGQKIPSDQIHTGSPNF